MKDNDSREKGKVEDFCSQIGLDFSQLPY